jgi:hypothetical protein
MSETHEVERARYKFRKFVQGLDACRATSTELFGRDCDAKPFVAVDRTEALDCFLRKYPAYERLRHQLAEVRRGQQKFFVDQELWKKACEE